VAVWPVRSASRPITVVVDSLSKASSQTTEESFPARDSQVRSEWMSGKNGSVSAQHRPPRFFSQAPALAGSLRPLFLRSPAPPRVRRACVLTWRGETPQPVGASAMPLIGLAVKRRCWPFFASELQCLPSHRSMRCGRVRNPSTDSGQPVAHYGSQGAASCIGFRECIIELAAFHAAVQVR